MNVRFRAQQIVRLMEFASTEFDIQLTTLEVARPFDVSQGVVHMK
jgi:hypothetical protein